MTNKTRNTIVAAVLTAFAAVAATGSTAETGKIRKPGFKPGGPATVSAPFTGTLRGIVTIGGKRVAITPNTTVFKTGKGVQKRQVYAPRGSVVYASGHMENNVLMASLVVVTDRGTEQQGTPLTDAFRKPPRGEERE